MNFMLQSYICKYREGLNHAKVYMGVIDYFLCLTFLCFIGLTHAFKMLESSDENSDLSLFDVISLYPW